MVCHGRTNDVARVGGRIALETVEELADHCNLNAVGVIVAVIRKPSLEREDVIVDGCARVWR
jgi:hypothetical protein